MQPPVNSSLARHSDGAIFRHIDRVILVDVDKELEALNKTIASVFPDRGTSSMWSLKELFQIMADKRYGNKNQDSLDLLISDMNLIIPKIDFALKCTDALRQKTLKNFNVSEYLNRADKILLIVYDTFILHYESLSVTVPVKWIGSRRPRMAS